MGLSGHFYSHMDPVWSLLIVRKGFIPWVELPLQRRLCPIFMSGVGLPDIHEYSAVDGLSTGPPGMGRHNSSSMKVIRTVRKCADLVSQSTITHTTSCFHTFHGK